MGIIKNFFEKLKIIKMYKDIDEIQKSNVLKGKYELTLNLYEDKSKYGWVLKTTEGKTVSGGTANSPKDSFKTALESITNWEKYNIQ